MTRRSRLWRAAFGLTVLIGIVLVLWGFWLEPRRLTVKEVTLHVPNWSPENNGTRIAVLTDLHVGSPFHGIQTLRRIVDLVNSSRPDLVLILGDLVIQGVVAGEFVPPEAIGNELTRLRSPGGTYAVLGNHDWWLDAQRVESALRAAGVQLLEDRATNVTLGNRTFWVAGVSDYWEGAHDVGAALRQVPQGAPIVLFTHNPDIFPGVPAHVALTLAGHTHGGQVRLPLVGAPVVPSDHGQRYATGHIVEHGRHLYVSNGTGTSILPVRFRVPPEIVFVTLYAAKES